MPTERYTSRCTSRVPVRYAVREMTRRSKASRDRPALSDYLTTFLWSGIAGLRSAADLPGGWAAR
jgi:hypothetical protein